MSETKPAWVYEAETEITRLLGDRTEPRHLRVMRFVELIEQFRTPTDTWQDTRIIELEDEISLLENTVEEKEDEIDRLERQVDRLQKKLKAQSHTEHDC